MTKLKIMTKLTIDGILEKYIIFNTKSVLKKYSNEAKKKLVSFCSVKLFV